MLAASRHLTHLASPLLVHLIELREIALVLVQLVIVQVDDVRGDCVQEIPALMIDDHNSSGFWMEQTQIRQ